MTYCVPEYIHARTVHDEMMIFDARTNEYLGLNPTGAAVWEVLADGGGVVDAVDTLVTAFDVARETAERDVAGLLSDLRRLGIITPVAP